ncbi:hypothetical protein [Aliiroseovarius sp. 2305UL8-7]|uniref:hypothetical protein n=1 Tax=Aliiroseovarius conchicola TaxID=3121637 RepID=UPI003529BD5E
MNVFWTCTTETWSPAIGDPDLLGWATTLLYLAAAFLAFRTARLPALESTQHRFVRYFWLTTAVLLTALAANKQLDLQTFIVAAGRCVSQVQGWYGMRRGVQMAFALGVAGLLGAWAIWIMVGLRHSLLRMWLELLGVAAVVAFVMLRALRFLHVYHTHVFGNNSWASRIFEITGPILLIIAALLMLRAHANSMQSEDER